LVFKLQESIICFQDLEDKGLQNKTVMSMGQKKLQNSYKDSILVFVFRPTLPPRRPSKKCKKKMMMLLVVVAAKINSKGNTECTILSLNGGILATRMRKLLLGCMVNFKGARGTYG